MNLRTATLALVATAGALLAIVILLVVQVQHQDDRITSLEARVADTRERLIEDEIAVCETLRDSPDPEQSRQIADLARASGDRRLAADALRSETIPRLPGRCR